MNRENEQKIIRRHYVFHGGVQGVGFRYVAAYSASRIGATGWVRNEYDGSVTMEIQGLEEQIDYVIQALRSGRYIHIYYMKMKEIPPVTDEREFCPVY